MKLRCIRSTDELHDHSNIKLISGNYYDVIRQGMGTVTFIDEKKIERIVYKDIGGFVEFYFAPEDLMLLKIKGDFSDRPK